MAYFTQFEFKRAASERERHYYYLIMNELNMSRPRVWNLSVCEQKNKHNISSSRRGRVQAAQPVVGMWLRIHTILN